MKMPNNCLHSNTEMKKHEKIFNKEVFSYEAITCLDCGGHAWVESIEVEYNNWLNDLHKNSKKRHLFQVQYSISETAKHCLSHLRGKFPGVDLSLLVRALVIIYLDEVETNEEISEGIEKLTQTYDYKELLTGDQIKAKIGFKPQGMKDILATANLFGVKPSKVIEESLYRMLILSINEDDDMKKFWESLILSRVEIILKSA